MDLMDNTNRKTTIKVVAANSIGVILETYDFYLFAFLAPIIASLFFPSHDNLLSLLFTYTVFAMGFLIRPAGAILFSHFGDKIGRLKVIIFTISLMTAATCLMGLLPTYAQFGAVASIFFIFLRLLQGISSSGEVMGAITYVYESSTGSDRRGYITAIIWASTGIGMLLSAILVAIATNVLKESAMQSWGWRILFLSALPTGLIGYYLRKSMHESTLFQTVKKANEIVTFPLLEVFKKFKKELAIVIGLYILSAISAFLSVFMPTYAKIIGISYAQAMLAGIPLSIFQIILIISAGYISDIFGRKAILLSSSIGLLLFSIPLFYVIVNHGYAGYIIAQIILSFFFAGIWGPITVTALEMFPTYVRYSACAFGFTIAYALFGGTTPLIATYLIKALHNNLAPGFYLMFGALIAIIASFKLGKLKRYTA